MTNQEINAYLFTEIMGNELSGVEIPQYTSDDSPRKLLNEVVAKVIKECGLDAYGRALTNICFQGGPVDDADHAEFLMNTPAEQISRACVSVFKEQK